MKKYDRKIKTCVNCRHLEIIEEGQMVKGLQDTAYIMFKCNVFNFAGKEVFSFPRVTSKVVIESETEECPFWEEWVKTSEEKAASKGSEDDSESEPDEY